MQRLLLFSISTLLLTSNLMARYQTYQDQREHRASQNSLDRIMGREERWVLSEDAGPAGMLKSSYDQMKAKEAKQADRSERAEMSRGISTLVSRPGYEGRRVHVHVKEGREKASVMGNVMGFKKEYRAQIITSLRNDIDQGKKSDATMAQKIKGAEAEETLSMLLGSDAVSDAGVESFIEGGADLFIKAEMDVSGQSPVIGNVKPSFNSKVKAYRAIKDGNKKSYFASGTRDALRSLDHEITGGNDAKTMMAGRSSQVPDDRVFATPTQTEFVFQSGEQIGITGGGQDGTQQNLGSITVPDLQEGESADTIEARVVVSNFRGSNRSANPNQIVLGPRVVEANQGLVESLRQDPNNNVYTTSNGGVNITSRNDDIGIAVGPGVMEQATQHARNNLQLNGPIAASARVVPGNNGVFSTQVTITPLHNSASNGNNFNLNLGGNETTLRTTNPNSIQLQLTHRTDRPAGATPEFNTRVILTREAITTGSNFATISRISGEDSPLRQVMGAIFGQSDSLMSRISSSPDDARFSIDVGTNNSIRVTEISPTPQPRTIAQNPIDDILQRQR